MKTVVLKFKNLSEEQIDEVLTAFLNRLPHEHSDFLGEGVSMIGEETEGGKLIFEIAKL